MVNRLVNRLMYRGQRPESVTAKAGAHRPRYLGSNWGRVARHLDEWETEPCSAMVNLDPLREGTHGFFVLKLKTINHT